MVVPFLEALIEDFYNRWGSDKNVLTYRQRKRWRPQGTRSEHLMETALNPRTKILCGIQDNEHGELWTIVSRRTARVAVTKQVGHAGATVSPAVSDVRLAAHAASSSASKRPRNNIMAASMAHAGQQSSAPPPHLSQDATVEGVVKAVETFK